MSAERFAELEAEAAARKSAMEAAKKTVLREADAISHLYGEIDRLRCTSDPADGDWSGARCDLVARHEGPYRIEWSD